MAENTKVVTAAKARVTLGQILDDVRYRKVPYIVERNGRPVAAIMDIEEFRRIERLLSEEQFIEEYSDERIKEFMAGDRIDQALRKRVARRLAL